MTNFNPLTAQDYPDPDIIRVDDTYYLLSTTMHFFPGGSLLRSYDLINWEPLGFLYDTLDETPEENYEHDTNIYGRGMWAPCLRYFNGTFYALFVSIEKGRTYIFTSKDPSVGWEKHSLNICFYDASLLFDEGKLYVFHGNTNISVTELDINTFAPVDGGLNKLLFTDTHERILGYEGTHVYKKDGKYLIFNIHWPKEAPCIRTQVVHYSDCIEGPYEELQLLKDDYGLPGKGVAQGGIIDTPEGDYYGFFFRDQGACGRIPILTPMYFKDGIPFISEEKKIPSSFHTPKSTRPDYKYLPLYTNDFATPLIDKKSGTINYSLCKQWQFNHCPDKDYLSYTKDTYSITTNKIASNLVQSRNMLTQRTLFDKCSGEVTINASLLNDGDYAGLCILQSNYAALAVSKETGYYYLNLLTREDKDMVRGKMDVFPGNVIEKIRLSSPNITVRLTLDFENLKDTVGFSYKTTGRYEALSFTHNLSFKLDHFCGARFGLFMFSTAQSGGTAKFDHFKYKTFYTFS